MVSETLRFLTKSGTAVPRESLRLTPLGGGLESAVARAIVQSASDAGRKGPAAFVVKQLRGPQRREAEIYRTLWAGSVAPPAVRLLGSEPGENEDYLFLEDIPPATSWPWSELEMCATVCRILAGLHRRGALADPVFTAWDYEAELALSATATLDVARNARGADGQRLWRRLGDLERVVTALPRLRREILGHSRCIIHGDMHPGNVIVSRRDAGPAVMLIDWARARLGSPLEDLASWLHSLGCWEPEGRRKHDALVAVYLAAGDTCSRFTPDFRRLYWYASASNALAGAIRYHLCVLADPASSEAARNNACCALPAWERVIRRTASLLPPRGLAE